MKNLLIENSVREIKVGRYMEYIGKILQSMDEGRPKPGIVGTAGAMTHSETRAILNHVKSKLIEKYPEDEEIIEYAFYEWMRH